MTGPAGLDVRAAGDAAVLADAGTGAPVPARLAAALAAERIRGVTDIIPGAQTVLVVTEPGSCDLGSLARRIRELAGAGLGAAGGTDPTGPEGDLAEIPVLYDGPDLAEVATLTGLSQDEVVARHSAAEYLVGWLGFSPGFAYLTGLDPALHVPRMASPRTAVPAGAVAIAGPLAAVYPSSSPGGWRLLGRTSARMWDPARAEPATLRPGMRVRFRPVTNLEPAPGQQPRGGQPENDRPHQPQSHQPQDHQPPRPQQPHKPQQPHSNHEPQRAIEVRSPGPLATVQDLGRPGYGHLGVPRSGAADAGSLRLANRLVGNPENAAGLEFTLGGAALRFHTAAWVAVTGAPADVRLRAGHAGPAGDRSGIGVPFRVPAGTELTVSAPAAGLRSYLAVRGGIDVPPVLASRSSDGLSGLGPAPLRPGDVLPIGTTPGCGPIVADVAPLAGVPGGPGGPSRPGRHGGPAELRVVPGPRDDWFGAGALDLLRTGEYVVTGASDRTGLRLDGPPLPRGRDGELPSEGMVTGALQVPPDGLPILFLTDHPVTGGYPVIAVVASADIGRAAQLRPGDAVTFRPIGRPIGPPTAAPRPTASATLNARLDSRLPARRGRVRHPGGPGPGENDQVGASFPQYGRKKGPGLIHIAGLWGCWGLSGSRGTRCEGHGLGLCGWGPGPGRPTLDLAVADDGVRAGRHHDLVRDNGVSGCPGVAGGGRPAPRSAASSA
jgi:KipI family sensor histidine kinase inhibitor